MLVNFWATWCVPCRDEMPELERLSKEETRLQVIGVTLDDDANLAREFLRRSAVSFPNYRAPSGEGHVAGVRIAALPETWLVDGKGRVLARMTGTRRWSDAAQRRELRERLDEAARPRKME